MVNGKQIRGLPRIHNREMIRATPFSKPPGPYTTILLMDIDMQVMPQNDAVRRKDPSVAVPHSYSRLLYPVQQGGLANMPQMPLDVVVEVSPPRRPLNLLGAQAGRRSSNFLGLQISSVSREPRKAFETS